MQNPKVLGRVGLLLSLLGCGSYGLLYTFEEVSREALELAAGSGILCALGRSTLAITGLEHLELRVQALERAKE
ncbi:MAG: hypothetical protein KF729_31560 [Sandaracinaceae bacterium]|nr:hypothetical protein [Sandaracinaceae bacterium]